MAGYPCGNSYISMDKLCRVDGSNPFGPKTGVAIQSLFQEMDYLSPESRKNWTEVIEMSLNGKLRTIHLNGTPYTTDELDHQVASRAKSWQKLMQDGPPSQLKMRDGSIVPAPEGMMPSVSNTGRKYWIHPDTGYRYSAGKRSSKKEGGELLPARQSRTSKMDSARRAEDLVSFRRTSQERGTAWPAKSLPPSNKPLDPVTIKEGLSKKEKDLVRFNGLDFANKEGLVLREYYARNPKQAEDRLDEVIARYAAQDGRSGVTGSPIALPGLDAKPGQERSSVDHFTPISTGRGTSGESLRKNIDNSKNFVLTEEGFNAQRGNRPWGSYGDKWEKELVSGKVTLRQGSGAWGTNAPSTGTSTIAASRTPTPKARTARSPRTPVPAPKTPVARKPKVKAVPKSTAPKVKTAAQKTAEREFIQQKLSQAKADKRSGDIKIWEDALRKL